MNNNYFEEFGLYELFYRGIMLDKKEIINLDINISNDTNIKVMNILKDLEYKNSKYIDEKNSLM